MKSSSFLFGYSIFSIPKNEIEKLINLCNAQGLGFGDIKIEDDSDFASFSVPLLQERRLLREAKKCSLDTELIGRRGIPALIIRYRRRAGLLVGAILTAIIFSITSGLVWDIRIEGSDKVNKEKITASLAECGFSVGTKIDGLDTAKLENRMLIVCDEISWISVNIKGTVASVVVRGAEYPLHEEKEPLCSNVIASQGGKIVGFEDIRGDICVRVGDEVSKGQVLISGVAGDEGEPLRLMASKGRVLAEVEEEIKIEIPEKYQKKITKKVEIGEKYLIFFKNAIKIFSNSRNSTSTYDKIEVIENLYTKNGKKMPFAQKTVKYVEYEYITATRSDEEMQALAEQKLFRHINENLEGAEILSRSISAKNADGRYILTCKIKCIKNIAEQREVEIIP